MIRRALSQPAWRLIWRGQNVTRDLEGQTLSVSYADELSGASDTLEVVFEDADGRWAGSWYPDKGDLLDLAIGYRGEPHLPCGLFELDEMEHAGPPDRLSVRCLAAGIVPALRSRKDRAFEDAPLQEIVETVAADHDLEVVGDFEGVEVERISQSGESDLAFLTRLAQDFGYVFSVRGRQLVFQAIQTLEAQPPSASLARSDLTRWRFLDTSRQIYRACEVSYFDPHLGKTHTATVEDERGASSGDVLRRTLRCEDEEQARRRAWALLHRANSRTTTGQITLPGTPTLMAGLTIMLSDLGRFSGAWLVESSMHRLERGSGYTTEIEVRRV